MNYLYDTIKTMFNKYYTPDCQSVLALANNLYTRARFVLATIFGHVLVCVCVCVCRCVCVCVCACVRVCADVCVGFNQAF